MEVNSDRRSRPSYSKSVSPATSPGAGFDGIHVRADWDHLFYQLLKRVSLVQAILPQQQLMAGTEIVVWGAIHLEALANRRLWEYAEKIIKEQEQRQAFWRLMRNSEFRKKLETIADLTKTTKRMLQLVQKRTTKLFELRNRIVHYKESATHIPNDNDFPDFIMMFQVLDAEDILTDLEREFSLEAIEKLRVNVLRVSDWLYRLKLPAGESEGKGDP